MCDSGKGETFCERSKKEQSARKISRCARNDSVEGCSYPTYPAKAVPGKHSSRIVIGSEACPQSHLSIYFHSTPCISNNYLFFQFGILEIHASKKTWRK